MILYDHSGNSSDDEDRDDFVKRVSSTRPGIGLALGGGLARGFAHIGILKVFKRNGIEPSLIAGTSIGAVVGAAYLADKLDVLEDWANGLNRMSVLSYLDFRVRGASMIGGTRLRKLLEENFSGIQIEDLPHPFIAIAADLYTGHEIWLRKGSLVDAMIASFSLPGIFPPVDINHRKLVDGALVNPVPVSTTLALGARMTIAVDLNADQVGRTAQAESQGYNNVAGFDFFNDKDVPPDVQKGIKNTTTKRLFRRQDNNPSLFGVMFSALGIMNDRITRSRLAGDPPDIHIKPLVGHIGMVEFERASDLIRLGEEAAERVVPDILQAMEIFLPPDN
ncbi:MAG: patatin-like phospholipase family protein [Micavibrio sp.]|nr:patatin-like phospholipase family protein [Micavibrio sp.]